MKFSYALIFTACVPISFVSAAGQSAWGNPKAAEYFASNANGSTKPAEPVDGEHRDVDGDEMSCQIKVKLSTESPESTGGADATDDPSKCRTLILKCSEKTKNVLMKIGSGAVSGVVRGAAFPGVLIAYLMYSGYVMCENCEEKCAPQPEEDGGEEANASQSPKESTTKPAEQNKMLLWLKVIDDAVKTGVKTACKWTCERLVIGLRNCCVGTFACDDRNRSVGSIRALGRKIGAAKRKGFKKSLDEALDFKSSDACLEKTGKSCACVTKLICKGINYFCYCCRAVKRKKNTEDDEGSDGSVIDGEDAVEIVEGVMACVVSCSK